ncbi:MAG: MG2 domain-containing protein [Kofleriaceae bacterium]|nr:MG2 domain-containing protein [Kofleriaceae bacterium]
MLARSWHRAFPASPDRLTRRHVIASYAIAAGTLAGVLAAVAGCGGAKAEKGDLQVMSFSPQGSVDKAEPVEIRFDKPVVDESMVGKPASPVSVVISPAITWKGFWQDRQTLTIEPTEPLAASTKYKVTLGGELGKRTAGFGFAFVHRPLAVEGVWGVDAASLAPDGNVPLSFNQPVRAADAAKHCLLKGLSGDIALGVPPGAPVEDASNVSLKPAQTLHAGASYALVCSDLAGAGGNATLDKPYSLAVRARPAFAVERMLPASTDAPADEVTISVKFTTPVALDEIRKVISSTPAIPGLDGGYTSGDGTEYTVTADLDPKTTYKLTVGPLVDTFGQKLDKPTVHEFRTGDARPRLSMERGIYALEASAKGYPLWSRNVGRFELECAAIPRDKLVQVLTTDMNYDPWGGNDDDKPIEWKKLKAKAKTTSFTTSGKNKWLLNELALGASCAGEPGKRGVFLAEVRSDEVKPDPQRAWLAPRRNRVLANVTDMGVLIKTGTSSGLVWVTSLSSGQPISGARVAVYNPQGKQVWVDMTNADGIMKIPGSALLNKQKPVDDEEESFEDWDSYRSQRLIAVVEKDNDLAIVDGNWSNGIQIWNFGLPEDRQGGVTKIRGFIQSDRGLYRPGERVSFKGIAREVAQGLPPRVPGSKKVEIEIQDSRGQTVLTKNTTLSSFGGFAFELDLGPEASLGDYYVRASVADQTFREKFSVEEFRPASFELALAAATKAPRPGERLAFDLDAKYLFGAPVAGAKVEWSLRKRTHVVRFPGWEQYSFSADPQSWWWYDSDEDYGEFISDGTGATNAQGRIQIAARDNANDFTGPVDYILSANVTDAADQTMGETTIVTAHKTSLYLGMHANEFVQAVGMPFGVDLVALTPDGKRTTTKAKLTMTRIVRSCVWTEVGARSYQRCDSSEKQVLDRDVTIAGSGTHVERIYPTDPGDYVLKIEAKDGRGNVVTAASGVWVIGKGEAFWSGDEGARMTVIASKPSYQAGDKARLVAQANLVKPTALITIERDGIIDAKVQKLDSASEGVELAISDVWAPNVYAGIALVSGRQGKGDKHRPQFKMGMVELKVASEHKQLDVALSLDNATVRPGDKVAGKILVTHKGQPVKADVSLSAADEGILQLIAYQTPNPMKTFYASYGLGVDAGTNWNRVARLADPKSGDPDEGGDGESAADGQRVRSKFVSSAYWAPMLVTNDAGEIAFEFTAPDNLTAFRLMAVAADTGDRFGAGELRLTINKPLMAAPALPRFLRAGDASSVGIVIHNRTDKAGTATVTAKATGATLDGARQTVNVPANGSARVRFGAKASENASAAFEFAVVMADENDAVRVTLPIGRPRVIDQRVIAETKLAASGVWTGTLGSTPDVLRKESELAITVDRSGLGDLAPGLRSLVEYPYGCLEQTMSRFVPLVAAKDLANTLDDPSLQGTKANTFIRAGVQKVIRHQQGDGQFSLWPQSQTYPHLTAYALWGLPVAQKAGEKVPNEVFDRGIAALSGWSNSAVKPDGDGATMAMGAYVMALRGKPDAGLNARLYAVRAGLPKWGQAFLLRAMHLAKADRAQLVELEQLLTANLVVKDGKALVREGLAQDQYEMYMTSDVRATAMTLAALLEVSPKSPLIDPLVLGLKAERSKAGTWESTQDNLWSLVALAEYGRRSTAGDTTATVLVGGKQVFKKKISGAEVATVRVPLGNLSADSIEVRVDNGAMIAVRATEARVDAGNRVANGFSISRRYFDEKGVEKTSFKAGELVEVRLSITADQARRWVAMVDPIPAGFEIVNAKLAAGGANLAPPPMATSPWTPSRSYALDWAHTEARDDRMQWFIDYLGAGTYELSYRARATIDGTFAVMPASIEAMYEPAHRGRTEKATVAITK